MRNKRMLYGRENVLVQCKCGSYLCLFTGLKTTDTDFISVSLLQVEMLTAYLFGAAILEEMSKKDTFL